MKRRVWQKAARHNSRRRRRHAGPSQNRSRGQRAPPNFASTTHRRRCTLRRNRGDTYRARIYDQKRHSRYRPRAKESRTETTRCRWCCRRINLLLWFLHTLLESLYMANDSNEMTEPVPVKINRIEPFVSLVATRHLQRMLLICCLMSSLGIQSQYIDEVRMRRKTAPLVGATIVPTQRTTPLLVLLLILYYRVLKSKMTLVVLPILVRRNKKDFQTTQFPAMLYFVVN